MPLKFAFGRYSKKPVRLTKLIVPLYSGTLIAKYVPADGPKSPETLWLIYAFTAMVSPVALVLAKRWMSKGMREKAA